MKLAMLCVYKQQRFSPSRFSSQLPVWGCNSGKFTVASYTNDSTDQVVALVADQAKETVVKY